MAGAFALPIVYCARYIIPTRLYVFPRIISNVRVPFFLKLKIIIDDIAKRRKTMLQTSIRTPIAVQHLLRLKKADNISLIIYNDRSRTIVMYEIRRDYFAVSNTISHRITLERLALLK